MNRYARCLAAALPLGASAVAQPPLTQQRIDEFHDLRFGMFVCWSFSTFSNVEWTRGVKDLSWFNPTGFEPEQWADVAADAGMRYILLLTKHHDGFCLWDTDTTDWKVTNSPLGLDVVEHVRRACDARGLRLAFYFSEGDWTWPGWKDPERKKAQLGELLTRYGPIEFIWFDHAQTDGGLDHGQTTAFVKAIQPDCLVGYNHGQASGDLRLGEYGHAAPLDAPGGAGYGAEDAAGYTGYVAAEFTFPIMNAAANRWFYTMPEWDDRARPPEEIYRHYLAAAEHRNIFSLDVGPNRSGRIRDVDARTLRQVGRYIRGEASPPPPPLTIGASAEASSVWSKNPGFGPEKVVDGDPNTRWGAEEGATAGWLMVTLPGPRSVSRAVIDEGNWNRVRSFELQVRRDAGWSTVAHGGRIGPQLELSFEPVMTPAVRLQILEATDTPTILEISLYER